MIRLACVLVFAVGRLAFACGMPAPQPAEPAAPHAGCVYQCCDLQCACTLGESNRSPSIADTIWLDPGRDPSRHLSPGVNWIDPANSTNSHRPLKPVEQPAHHRPNVDLCSVTCVWLI